jgi:hypothetical protein
MVPLAVLSQMAKEQSVILEDKEVYDEVNSQMEEVVWARSQGSQSKKAPLNIPSLLMAL